MKFKNLLLTGALAFASLSIANAKTYHITLDESAMAGNVQLGAGEYKVKVNGDSAIFTNVDTGKSTSAPTKVENASSKHDLTAVDTSKASGTNKIQAIELGGSTETLEFGE
ncbi:MAG TPA: hypothetical protein VKU19_04330 [Bryobacteraceae bacterium]|nr:hypothetical protein [Bryobacteraceae bacterium]